MALVGIKTEAVAGAATATPATVVAEKSILISSPTRYALLYTVPEGRRWRGKISNNYTTYTQGDWQYLVPAGGTFSSTSSVQISQLSNMGGTTRQYNDQNIELTEGDMIYGKSGASSAVYAYVIGLEYNA
jgi:hypothetical protein